MDTVKNTLLLLEKYNALIRYYTKADKDRDSGEKKIKFSFGDSVSLDASCGEVRQILQQAEYPRDFVYLINRLFLVCESISDLFAIHGNVERKMYNDYSQARPLERLSFGIYEFIRDEIIESDTGYQEFDGYPISETMEFFFKNDESIIWSAYYLLQNTTEAYLEQEKRDIEHQLSFKSEPDKEKFIQQQKETRVEEIINLSNGFCDKNLPFMYIRNNPIITQNNLFYCLLSEVLESIPTEEYEKYAMFDYPKYLQKKFRWNFACLSLDSFTDLNQLSGFNKLVRILTNASFIKEHTEAINVESTSEPIENPEELEEYLDRRDKELDKRDEEPKEKVKKLVEKERKQKAEYILSIPILDLIYQEFNDELWNNITQMEFLEMLTTDIKKQSNFKLKQKQTTRFYYLLKKIWINSSSKSLFDTEKEWVIPFLQNYNLSYSAYTNQSIKNEGGVKHRSFTRSVDKILPKDDIE